MSGGAPPGRAATCSWPPTTRRSSWTPAAAPRHRSIPAPGTRDGVVFFNDPASERAGVLQLDGGVRRIRKYDPANPDKGVTGPGRSGESAPASTPSDAPPPPGIPAPPPDPAHPTASVRIVLSKPRALVGE